MPIICRDDNTGLVISTSPVLSLFFEGPAVLLRQRLSGFRPGNDTTGHARGIGKPRALQNLHRGLASVATSAERDYRSGGIQPARSRRKIAERDVHASWNVGLRPLGRFPDINQLTSGGKLAVRLLDIHFGDGFALYHRIQSS